MKYSDDSSNPTLRQRPDFQSLLDQLETKIEHEGASPGALNVLSLRLLALHRQRARLGKTISSGEQLIGSKAKAAPASPEIPSVQEPTSPAALSKTMPTNKLQFWLRRQRKP